MCENISSSDENIDNYVTKTNKIRYKTFTKIKKSTKKLQIDDLYAKALNILNACGRTRAQLFNSLCAYGADPRMADDVLDELEKLGLIDDVQYAKDYFEQAVYNKNFGPRRIKQSLYEKGISNEIISEILCEYDYTMQLDIARKVALKKLLSYKKLDYYKQKQKLYSILANKGFNYDVICEITYSLLNETD